MEVACGDGTTRRASEGSFTLSVAQKKCQVEDGTNQGWHGPTQPISIMFKGDIAGLISTLISQKSTPRKAYKPLQRLCFHTRIFASPNEFILIADPI